MTEVDYKIDYITRLFSKITHKKYESYVIQRIWHRLNNDEVLFVGQQYISRGTKYALADLYLPQINLIIEIDEIHHDSNEAQILDEIRSNDIRRYLDNVVIKRIAIFKNHSLRSLTDIHNDIDNVVSFIQDTVSEYKSQGKFIPWSSNYMTPNYYHQKGYLDVYTNDYVRTIDEIGEIFNTKVPKKGWQRPGGFLIDNNIEVWTPRINNDTWCNEMTDDGKIFYEYNKVSDEKRLKHLNEQISQNKIRIVFYKQKDFLGINQYKFVGVFKMNIEASQKEGKCVWKRISTKYIISNENN